MKTMIRKKILTPAVIVIILTVVLHVWAVSLLPQDYDEPVYLQNAFDYVDAFRTGGINAVIDYSGTSEHPALTKILYAVVVGIMGDAATWVNAFYANRIVSAVFGVLAVTAVTLAVDPLSGAFLALDTLNVKYTSQVYLEALPHFFTIAAVLAYLRVERKKHNRWLWLSAIALGAAAASKYSYVPVILIVLAYIAVFEKKTPVKWLLLYGVVGILTFFFLNVHLWHDPIGHLADSLSFHVQYSQGAHVQEVGYPWYQPLVWIFTSSPANWHPQVFFYYGFDAIFAILAVIGLPQEWKERRWLVVWLIAGVIFLLLWPTKWPQYAMTVTPAICLAAAGTARRIFTWLRSQNTYWDYLRNVFPAPGKGLWIAIGAFVLFILAIYLSAAGKLAVGRIGWSSLSSTNSPLPGNTVNAILPMQDGRMLLGTGAGAVFWTPSEDPDGEAEWEILTTENSGLISGEILSLATTNDGAETCWFGTSSGLSSYDGTSWRSYSASDMGLPDDTILALASGPDGWIYAGTLNGSAVYNGKNWASIDQTQGEAVFAITLRSDELWLSVAEGVWQVPLSQGDPAFHPLIAPARHLLIDSSGQVWAATTGAGLAHYDGAEWQYFTTSNSDIPFNTVNWVEETQPGELWVATAYPNNAGGVIASFRDGVWHSYLTNNSGTSGSEPLVIASNIDGTVWIGTRSLGIDQYLTGR